MRTQCQLLGVARSSLDYLPVEETALNARIKRLLDELYLRELSITRADQVWCADITYIPMKRGSAYLCAVMDWHTRCVLGWAVSNTMDTSLCLLALERAKARAKCGPEIFNTDRGSQFTSAEWTGRLSEWGVKISMDGKGRWMDNVFIERLWRKPQIRGHLHQRIRHGGHAGRGHRKLDDTLQYLATA